MFKDIVKKSSGLTGDAARAAYRDALQALERVYGSGNVWSKANDSEIDALESIERSIGYQKSNTSSPYKDKETLLPSVGESMGKSDLKKILDELSSGDDAYYGIRSIPHGETAQVGSGVLPSRVWEIGNDYEWLPTEEFADGPSAISLRFPKSLDISEQYSGEKALLRSEDLLASQPWNIDPGEIVMRDPVVQAVFKTLPSGDWERVRTIAPYAAGAGLAGGLLSVPDNADAALPPRWYHGSRVKDIDVLQHTNTPSNKRTGYNYGRGVYGSSEPVGTVDAYSDWDKGAVYGFNTPTGVLDMTEMGDADRAALKNIIEKRGKYLDPNVVDQYSDKPLLDRLIHEFGPGNVSDVIREAGYNGHAFTYGGMPGEKWGVFYDPQKAEKIRSLIPAGLLAGAALASPEDAWASYNEPPRDAIEESWNPVEALVGGLGGGVASAFAGVPMDLAATIGMDRLGGLLSAPGGNAANYGNIRSWR